MWLKSLAVFCGASPGNGSTWNEMIEELSWVMKNHQTQLVYGGASVGLMGKLADACLEKKLPVVGVIPEFLKQWEVAHSGLSKLIIVQNMHERKYQMYQLSDAFLALPGGLGTLDELCEVATWSQLKLHNKPIFVWNYQGFYDNFFAHLRYVMKSGFLRQEHYHMIKEIKNINHIFNS